MWCNNPKRGRMASYTSYLTCVNRKHATSTRGSNKYNAQQEQWFSQKSGGDSAVSSEFVIAGMIFHHSRVKSELLHKDIEQSLVELTLFPTCHREDVWCLTLRHTQVRSAHEIERCQ